MQNKVFADSAAIEAESAKLNGERSETTKTDRSASPGHRNAFGPCFD